jgi:hypothetical protein
MREKHRPERTNGLRFYVRARERLPEKTMEASENAGPPFEGCGGPGLHRIDLEQVRASLNGSSAGAGYARLALMMGEVLPRLMDEAAKPRPG